MISIQRQLTVSLSICIFVLCAIATALSVYYHYNSRNSERDAQLVQTAKIIQTLLQHQTNEDLEAIQLALDELYKNDEEIAIPEYQNQTPLHDLMKNFQFQIKSLDGPHRQTILKSPDAPLLSKDLEGFENSKGYRFYQLIGDGYTIIVSQKTSVSQYFSTKNSQISIVVLLTTMLISIAIINYIIHQNLGSLRKMTQSIKKKNVHHLSPINLNEVPLEIQPVVDALNQIFNRINDIIQREKRFAQDAAHELKTPLASMKALSQIALNYQPKDNIKIQLNKIIDVINQQTHIVNQLLTLSRTLSNTQLEAKPINIKPLIVQMIANIAPQALNKEIEIILDALDEPFMICIDESSLHVLLRNLIDNAIRYSPKSSQINVKLSKVASNINIEFIDQGPGIPEKDQERVLERFHRILGSNQPGSGLGLNIVKEIVDHYHGNITLKNNQPTGLIASVSFSNQEQT